MASGNEIPEDKQPDCNIPLQGVDFIFRQNELVSSVGSNPIDAPVQYTFMPEVSRSYVAPDILFGGLDFVSNNPSNSVIDLNIGQDWGDTALASNQFSGFPSFESNPGNVSQPACPVSFDDVLSRDTKFSVFQNLTDGRCDEHVEPRHITQPVGHINSGGTVWPQTSTNFMHGDAVSVPVIFHNLLYRAPEGAGSGVTGSNPSISSQRVEDTILALGTQFSKPDLSTQFRDFNNNDKRISFPDLNSPVIENVPQSFHWYNKKNSGISSPQNNVGGFSNRTPNLVDVALYNNSGLMYGTNSSLGVHSSHISELSRLGTQHFLPIPRDSSFSLEGNNYASPTEFSVNRGAPDHFSLTSGAYDGFLDEGNYGRQAKMPRLTLQSSKNAFPSIQPSSNQIQRQVVKSPGNSMTDPINISPTGQGERSSGQQDQFGAPTRSEGRIVLEAQDLHQHTNIGKIVPVKKRTGLSKALNVSSSPSIDVPNQHHSTGLGIQNSVPHYNFTGQVISMLKPSAEVQASSVLSGVSNKNSSLKYPPFIPVHLPLAQNVPGSTNSNAVTEVQQVPASVIRPSLKKRTASLITSTPQARRRNITPQSVKEFSVPSYSRSVPPGRRLTQLGSQITQSGSQTVQPAYIKRRDSDRPVVLPVSGEKCPLCKRDLSYMPDGHMYQPSVPPAVAVLPCGHVFHDHCLQLITPPDQSKDPPCIPCAIGE